MHIIYFNGKDIHCFYWVDGTLETSIQFNLTEESLLHLNSYLEKSRELESKLLIDVPDEDFKIESIPILGGKNQQLLIKNTLKRYYRENIYTSYNFQKKDEKNKKNNLYLLSSLENNESIQKISEIIEKNKIKLSGIYSVPILAQNTMRRILPNKNPNLLLSFNSNNTIRQNYFNGGFFNFTRLVTLRSEVNLTKNHEKTYEIIIHELQSLAKFFFNQRLIGFDQTLQVYILLPDHAYLEFNKIFLDTIQAEIKISLTFLSFSSIIKHKKGIDPSLLYADFVFSYEAHKEKQKTHYQTNLTEKTQNYFLLKKISLFLSILLISLSVIMLAYTTTYTQKTNKEIQLIEFNQKLYQSKYQDIFKNIEKNLALTPTMEKTFLENEKINLLGRIHPINFLYDASNIFSKPEFNLFKLESIQWDRFSESPENQATTEATEDPPKKVRAIAMISGSFDMSKISYTDTKKLVDQLIEVIQKAPDVISVNVEEIPVDTRSKKLFQDKSEFSPEKSKLIKNFSFKVELSQ